MYVGLDLLFLHLVLLLVVTLGLIVGCVVFAASCRLLFCISFIVFMVAVAFVICCFRGLFPIAV